MSLKRCVYLRLSADFLDYMERSEKPQEPGRSWTEPDPAPIDLRVLRTPVHPRTLILAPGL